MNDPRARRLTLIACILGSAIVFVDQTVVNVALPALRDDLDASLADQQWVVEAYLLLLASLILDGAAGQAARDVAPEFLPPVGRSRHRWAPRI